MQEQTYIAEKVHRFVTKNFNALDFLPGSNLEEKITALMLERMEETHNSEFNTACASLKSLISSLEVERLKVVVLGGGTGLSNIIGGDSRQPGWKDAPFTGMKEIFSKLYSIVCITDDGGSTGELLKDLPLIALGDLRHVLLSALKKDTLKRKYNLDEQAAVKTAATLHALFNYRFISRPDSADQLLGDTGTDLTQLPRAISGYLRELTRNLFSDQRLSLTLDRPQCLGNLLLASSIYRHLDPELTSSEMQSSYQKVRTATIKGIEETASLIGAKRKGVVPCTTTLSWLQVLYANGVLVTSESKSGSARRGYPVDRVIVEFSRTPFVQPEVVSIIADADIIVLAPGSLYTSIIPILQVPGLSEAIRGNKTALKLLVSNIWVQTGETDAAHDSPERKFYVSDLIHAYHRNIPGGVNELFNCVLGLNMREIPGSVLQRYALENKEPIYFDRLKVEELGFNTVAARTYSENQLHNRGVIQHDPDSLAYAVKTLWLLKDAGLINQACNTAKLPPPPLPAPTLKEHPEMTIPCMRYEKISMLLSYLTTEMMAADSVLSIRMEEPQRRRLLDRLTEIIWLHPDIDFEHLKYFRGVTLVEPHCWNRCQEWDNVFSFYDPLDCKIKIRSDQTEEFNRFEVVFLIALGQSLLGNYALRKEMVDIHHGDENVGRMYKLTLREQHQLKSFLDLEEITTYLTLCKMHVSTGSAKQYNRVVNPGEGFTPPGLFFGLFYAWYLDNRFTPNIDYKMSVMKNDCSDLIPDQIRMINVRKKTIKFFREMVFRQRPIESVLQGKGAC